MVVAAASHGGGTGMNDAASEWDDFQRDVLDALGHVVYRVQDPATANLSPALLQALAAAAKSDASRLPPLPPGLPAPAAKRALWPRLRALRKAGRA